MSRKKVAGALTFPGLAQRIKIIRADQTQEEFGKRIGVKKATVSKYEKGRIPDVETLKQIADIGNRTLEWLLRGEQADTLDQVRHFVEDRHLGPDVSWQFKDTFIRELGWQVKKLSEEKGLLRTEIKRLKQEGKTADAATRLVEEAQLELGINLRPEQKRALLKMVRPALDSQRRAVKDTILSFYSQETK